MGLGINIRKAINHKHASIRELALTLKDRHDKQ